MLAANIIFALLWTLVLGPFSPGNLVAGFLIGFVLIWIAGGERREAKRYTRRTRAVAQLIWFTISELVKANLTVAWFVLVSVFSLKLKPAVLAIPLQEDATDDEITLLANLITLTPGTLSLDVADDRSALYVHFMNVTDPDREIAAIKDGFERRIREVTR